MTDDPELLRRYAEQRDEDAFAELVRRHVGLVYHAARRQCGGDAHRAEDVAQLVFTDLARKAQRLAAQPSLTGWLYTSTRYAAAQAVRAEARRQARERQAHAMNEVDASGANAEAAVEWDRLRPVIDDALHALGERDREAVLLRFFEGRAFADIATNFALSEDAARMRVERALDKMRLVLARRGVTSTGAALAAALGTQAGAAAPQWLATSVTISALMNVTAGTGLASAGFAFMAANKTTLAAVTVVVGVLALNMAQHRTNRRLETELHELTSAKRNPAVRDGIAGAATRAASFADAGELTKLRGQADELRKRITARGSALRNGGILRRGDRVITLDSPPGEKLEFFYPEGRSSPMRAWQTLLDLGKGLTRSDWNNHRHVDFEMMALMFCLDDSARMKVVAFLATLPADEQANLRSPERVLAPVLSEWLWKGDWPNGYGSSGEHDSYSPADPTMAYTSWQVTRQSGRKQIERFPFKRFDDGWRYGPLSAADAEQMLAMLDPLTGSPKSTEGIGR